MKWWFSIGIVLLVTVVGCNTPPPVGHPLSEGEGPTHEALEGIDSLMWVRPDSALTVMLEFATSPEADSLDEFNGHYCQVLVSELLYKNDWKQSNRENLLKAVGYFDSIVGMDGADTRGVSQQRGASLRERNAFIDARAHYINGVGFYERGDVANSCAEYLKTLEVMEEYFKEQELVGHKARFLAYTYNRLGDLFSEQFMMESSITCYENALVYCKIEPTSPIGVSNILYRIGKQYDKKNDIENASLYYGQALENLAETDNMAYRNIVASKALCDYGMNGDVKQALDKLNYTLIHAKTDNERLNRYLTIGGIHFLERNYDSAIFYLEPVFEDNDAGLQTQAAGYLRIVYDSIGDVEKSNVYMRFLTNQKKPDGENKALVSKLEDLYKNYSNKKLEKQAEAERKIAEKRVMNTIIPIAITVALAIFCVLVLRNRRQLKHQQDKTKKEAEQTRKRHASELEAEREAYQREREALRQNLRQREEQVNALETALVQQREEAERRREAFLKEPICQRINELLHGKHITTRDTSFKHEAIALKEEDYKQLKEAVERHYAGFDNALLSRCPSLRHSDLALCHLHLMGLGEGEIAALRSRTYSGIKKQNESLQRKLGVKEDIASYIMGVAEGLVDPPDGVLSEVAWNETQRHSQKSSQKIVDLIKERPEITTAEMAERIGVSRRSIVNITNRLQEEGVIRRVGPDKGGRWEVIR